MNKKTENKILYIVLASVFVILIAAAVFGYGYLSERFSADDAAGTEQDAQKDAVAAPEFTVVDNEGKEVSLSDFSGKPVIINFWATWCGPCKSELGAFEEMYSKYGDQVEFMMVNLTDGYRETIQSVSEFVEENSYDFPVYYDTKSSGAYAYSVYSIPFTVMVDAHGNVFNAHTGAMSAQMLENYIVSLLETVELI